MNRTQFLRDEVFAATGLTPDEIFIDGPNSNFAKKKGLVRYKLAFYGTAKHEQLEPVVARLRMMTRQRLLAYDPNIDQAYVITSRRVQDRSPYTSLIVWFRGQQSRAKKGVASTVKVSDNIPSPIVEPKVTNKMSDRLDKNTVMAVVNGEAGIAEYIAEHSLDAMLECSIDMLSGAPDDEPLPTVDSVREMAADYVSDMLDDLRTEVLRLINGDMKFEFETKVKREIVVTKKVIG